MLNLPAFHVGNYYWRQYTGSGLFDLDKKYRDAPGDGGKGRHHYGGIPAEIPVRNKNQNPGTSSSGGMASWGFCYGLTKK